MDISQNLNLEIVWCSNNLLNSLDVVQNTNIVSLICDDNQLSQLDVSQNLNLQTLICSDNQLINLDVSQNINLTTLICSDNNLNILLINNSNNHNMIEMFSTGNLNLSCIQIDDENATYPECQGFPLEGWCKDEWSSYSINCTVGIVEFDGFNFNLHPNPVKNKLFLDSKNNHDSLRVEIFSISGKLLSNQNLDFNKQTSIDVSNLSSGIYFLNIEDENGNVTVKKFIKK